MTLLEIDDDERAAARPVAGRIGLKLRRMQDGEVLLERREIAGRPAG